MHCAVALPATRFVQLAERMWVHHQSMTTQTSNFHLDVHFAQWRC